MILYAPSITFYKVVICYNLWLGNVEVLYKTLSQNEDKKKFEIGRKNNSSRKKSFFFDSLTKLVRHDDMVSSLNSILLKISFFLKHIRPVRNGFYMHTFLLLHWDQ